jgi:hypothetical protein
MLENPWVAERLATSKQGLSSMKWVLVNQYLRLDKVEWFEEAHFMNNEKERMLIEAAVIQF